MSDRLERDLCAYDVQAREASDLFTDGHRCSEAPARRAVPMSVQVVDLSRWSATVILYLNDKRGRPIMAERLYMS